jgi:hypothetical protein
MKKSMRKFFIAIVAIFISACGNVGYDDIKLGDSLASFKKKYANSECTESQSYTCFVADDDFLQVYLNKEEKIFRIEANKLVKNLTFYQALEMMKEKYGKPHDEIDASEWAQWCVNSDCSTKITMQLITPKRVSTSGDGKSHIISICDIYFYKNNKCTDVSPYLNVIYSDEKISGVWIMKSDTQLKKF